MRIRNYTPADLDALRSLHAGQGFGYPFPDPDSPLFVTKLVLEQDDDPPAPSGMGFSLPDFSGSAEGTDGLTAWTASREAAGEEVNGREAEAEHQSSRAEASRAEVAQPAAHQRSNPSRIVMAVLLRLTAEAYLLHDASAGTPRQRWQNLLALHEAARQDAAARGLDDVQAFLPPQVARAFGRRLARLGWRRDPWPCFSKTVES